MEPNTGTSRSGGDAAEARAAASQILERLEAEEMPPKPARRPMPQERRVAVNWFHAVREHERRRNAGDPGVVLARRLSSAEYNYTIRDLTGVDIQLR